MKNFLRTLIMTCFVCMVANIFSISASASGIGIPRTVRIQNMWNSNYMVNDNGIGKYSTSNIGEDCVWTIRMCSPQSLSIENWNGRYLRANDNGTVTCEFITNPGTDLSFQWTLSSTADGKYRITSFAYPDKAINIENLTGSLQLTTYYDTWESAKWILKDISEPEFGTKTGNVIFQTPDQNNYLFSGSTIGPASTGQAFIAGNMFYQIIDKGDYCYINYNPVNSSSPQYFKSISSTSYNFSTTVDDTIVDYRWKIEKNADGTISIVSVAHPEMCISNSQSSTLINRTTSGDTGKWNMHPANSLIIKISNSSHTHTLALNESDREKAIFKYSGNSALIEPDAQWQVIYNNGKMYLKNVLTGKYLKAGGIDNDTQAYVTDYDSSYGNLYIWNAMNSRYLLAICHDNGPYLHPDYPDGSYNVTEDMNAVVSYENGYTYTYLDFEIIGFAY